jgi:hypothetical protein
MAGAPKRIPSTAVAKKDARGSTHLTLLERAVERSTIDVAACIRWTFFGLAAVIIALNAGPLVDGNGKTSGPGLIRRVAESVGISDARDQRSYDKAAPPKAH